MQTVMTQTEFKPKALSHGYKTLAILSLMTLLTAGTKSSANEAPVINPLLALDAREIASAYGDQRVYSITRNGKKIGTHTLSFLTDADNLTVKVDSSITVRILRIPVYRLSYTADEVWQDNALVATSATTTENGDSNTVKWDNTRGDEADTIHYASNHWHPGVLTGTKVFNTLTGKASNINVTTVGVEQIEIGSGDILTATHYRYEDDIEANVWYDTNGLWLKMAFDGEDGSAIQYLRTD